jgi:signal transduction histidine kinase
LDKDGKEIFYSISCYPIYEKEELVAVVEISKDITKDINIQKTMMQQEKLAYIGRLAAGVAHEINNPMTTILTTAMLIQEDLDQEDDIYQELQTISDETLRCRKIVSSLLDFARQSKPVMRAHDINHIVGESMALTRKQAAFEDVTISSTLSEALPMIHIDRDQIQQALINLALNAIESIENGGEVKFITRFSSKDNHVEILVSDTGKGISESDLNRVFEPFFTTKESGTGLGMAITYGLIHQHGGTIDVESEMDKGTTFTIRLPVGEEGGHGR